MDVSHPIRAVVPSLDGPVLEVLARVMRSMTGREINRLAGVGSPSGTQKVLARLVEQGVVRMEEHRSGIFYIGNREHLAWPAVEILVQIRRTFLSRLEFELKQWDPAPVHASLFGSMARGDGDSGSDIDILLIRPDGIDEDESPWADLVDHLRWQVEAWTGNHCHAFQIDMDRLAEHVSVGDPLVDNLLRDSIKLAGKELKMLVRRLPHRGGDK